MILKVFWKLNVILERELLIGGRTVGGGTTLPAQAACLEAIGCKGGGRTAEENSRRVEFNGSAGRKYVGAGSYVT